MKKLTKRMARTKSWRKKKNCSGKKNRGGKKNHGKKKIVAEKKNNEANWMVSNSAKLDHRTKQHTQFGVSASNGSRDMARTRSWRKKKMNSSNPIKHPLRGSLIIITNETGSRSP